MSTKAMRFMAMLAVLFVSYLAVGIVFEREFILGSASWVFSRQKEMDKAKAAVTTYNSVLTDLYDTNGLPLTLSEFPTTIQLKHELYQILGFLRDRKLIQILDMASIEFLDAEMPSPWMAEVTTFEEWNYLYQNIKTRLTAIPIKGMGQGYKYKLVKKQGAWIIADYQPIDIDHDATLKEKSKHQ